MKKYIIAFLAVFIATLIAGCSHSSKKEGANWIWKSDEVALQFSRDLSQLYPSFGSYLGLREFDDKAEPLDLGIEEKSKEIHEVWLAKIERMLESETDPNLKIDYTILRDAIKESLESIALDEKYKVLIFRAGTRSVFGNLMGLINDQSPKERKAAGVERFKKMVRGFGEYKPYLVAAQEFSEWQLKKWRRGAFFPFRGEVEKYLSESESYQNGIEQILSQSGRDDWKEDFVAFKKRAKAYDQFVRERILPFARKSPRLPREIYILSLKQIGFDATPEELIALGQDGYKKLYKEFEERARKLAKKYSISSHSPKDVVIHLKQAQVTKPEEVRMLYQSAIDRLSKILKEKDYVTLPKTPAKFRLAGEAESKAQPVPHLNTPPLINNQGERPEFIIPTSKDGKLTSDDFSHAYIAINLAAHEARPGHDLQFSRILDEGSSLIRNHFAFNSVNAEGWGLYAEDLMFPYYNEEEQFFAIQMRLWRMARAFLDPQVQLGKIGKAQVIKVFHEELGVSKEMAQMEYDRYAFRSPGQAPAYYYGYRLILDSKERLKERFKDQWSEKCFHDTLLSYGLLPLKLSEKLMMETMTCN